MGLLQMSRIANVNVMIQRFVYELLRFVAGQLRDAATTK